MFSRNVLIPAAIAALIGTLSCAGQTIAPSPPSTTPAPPTTPAGPPKPLDGVTIGITAGGFRLDAATAAMFAIDALRVYKGARITFINQDTVPHDIQSDPIFVHTECPEIAGAGFLVPGQTKSSDPLGRLVSCGFHDHNHEGDPRFAGRANVEDR